MVSMLVRAFPTYIFALLNGNIPRSKRLEFIASDRTSVGDLISMFSDVTCSRLCPLRDSEAATVTADAF